MDHALFRQFPLEIWTMILDEVWDHPDLENLCLASSHQLGEILKPRKTNFLFSKVIEVLMESNLDLLPKTDVLNCRKVCKSWKDAIDTAIPKSPCFHRHNSRYPNHDRGHCWLKSSKQFDYDARIERLVAQVRSDDFRDCILFLTKSICFTDMQPAEKARAFEELKWILKAHGKDFWHFQFTLVYCKANDYLMLVELLKLLPNLRTLEVFMFMYPDHFCDSTWKGQFNTNPLPRLNKLKSIKLDYVPEVIVDEILQNYSHQLKKLVIGTGTRPGQKRFYSPSWRWISSLELKDDIQFIIN